MGTINWKERAEQIAELYENGNPFYLEDVVGAMMQFAKEVHDKACEEQKLIDAEHAKIEWRSTIDRDSILNSPNANFE